MFEMSFESSAAGFGSPNAAFKTPLGCLSPCAIVKTHTFKRLTPIFETELPGKTKACEKPTCTKYSFWPVQLIYLELLANYHNYLLGLFLCHP